jgi:hypothetical protein
MMTIESSGKNALMENVLWREFMTGRLDRFSPIIEFSLVGKNTETDLKKKRFLFSKKKLDKYFSSTCILFKTVKEQAN